jgi:hypothetical protein
VTDSEKKVLLFLAGGYRQPWLISDLMFGELSEDDVKLAISSLREMYGNPLVVTQELYEEARS